MLLHTSTSPRALLLSEALGFCLSHSEAALWGAADGLVRLCNYVALFGTCSKALQAVLES